VKRYYLGVDWADQFDQVWVGDAEGNKVWESKVAEKAEGLAEFGRWLDEQRSVAIELWAAIEKPAGRIVDFLLDHGVVVYPVNPKALDRARDRFRMSQSKSDSFDAYVWQNFCAPITSICERLSPTPHRPKSLNCSAETFTV
jgi:hypothetical protein